MVQEQTYLDTVIDGQKVGAFTLPQNFQRKVQKDPYGFIVGKGHRIHFKLYQLQLKQITQK